MIYSRARQIVTDLPACGNFQADIAPHLSITTKNEIPLCVGCMQISTEAVNIWSLIFGDVMHFNKIILIEI